MRPRVVADPRLASRLKLAEVNSTLGAGVLGGGIGILLARWLDGFAVPVLAIGLLMHAWGMRGKHGLEAGRPQPAWATALYWACWSILGALALYALARVALGGS